MILLKHCKSKAVKNNFGNKPLIPIVCKISTYYDFSMNINKS